MRILLWSTIPPAAATPPLFLPWKGRRKRLHRRKYLGEIDSNYNCSDHMQCDRVNIWTFLPLHWEIPATMSWLFGQKWRQQSSGQIFVNQPKNYTAVPVLMLDDWDLSDARLYF